jgi:hypothetical protein
VSQCLNKIRRKNQLAVDAADKLVLLVHSTQFKLYIFELRFPVTPPNPSLAPNPLSR